MGHGISKVDQSLSEYFGILASNVSGVEREGVLLLSPVPLISGGGGSHIRVANNARALALYFDVHNCVILHSRNGMLRLQKAGDPRVILETFPLSLPRDVFLAAKLFLHRVVLQSALPVFAGIYSTHKRLRALTRRFSGEHYEIAFVYRTSMAPYAVQLKGKGIVRQIVLDIDDIESATYDRFARLAEQRKQFLLAHRYKKLARKYREFENTYFPLDRKSVV